MRLIALLFVGFAVPALAQTSASTGSTVAGVVGPHNCDLRSAYPRSALRVNAKGTATVAFTITTSGTVAGVSVKKSSGNAALDDAAVSCVQKWTYPPPTENGFPKELQKEVVFEWKSNYTLPPPREIVVPVVTCITDAHPSKEALDKAARDTEVYIRFGGSRPLTDIFQSSGNRDRDGLVVDCVQKLPPQLFPDGMRFIIPFSWTTSTPPDNAGPR